MLGLLNHAQVVPAKAAGADDRDTRFGSGCQDIDASLTSCGRLVASGPCGPAVRASGGEPSRAYAGAPSIARDGAFHAPSVPAASRSGSWWEAAFLQGSSPFRPGSPRLI